MRDIGLRDAKLDRGLVLWFPAPASFTGEDMAWAAAVCSARKACNLAASVLSCKASMYDQRTSLSDQVVDDVRRVLGEKVYTTIIPRNVRVAESPSHGKPVLLYDYRCSGSQAYIQLASEVIERERRMRAA